MGYLGNKPTAVPLTSSDLADNIITSAKIANGAITGDDINSTFNIGSKTVTLPSASVTAHVTATDLQPIKSDLTALAIREATNEASAAFNLPSSFIETFTDDTNLGTQTTGDRVSGYWATVYSVAGSQVAVAQGTGTAIGTYDTSTSAAFDGTTNQAWNASARASTSNHSFTNPKYIGKDWGSGVTKYITGFDFWSSNDDAIHSNGSNTDSCVIQLIGHSSDAPGSGTVLGEMTNLNFRLTNTRHQKLDIAQGTAYRYHWCKTIPKEGVGDGGAFCAELVLYETPLTTTANATGTLIQSANAVTGTRTTVGGTMLYKDNAGTATLGTDLKIYFTANGGTNWTEAAGYTAITPVYSSGVKQVRLTETTVTGGTDVRYKAVYANQAASSKETQLHAIGINY